MYMLRGHPGGKMDNAHSRLKEILDSIDNPDWFKALVIASLQRGDNLTNAIKFAQQEIVDNPNSIHEYKQNAIQVDDGLVGR